MMSFNNLGSEASFNEPKSNMENGSESQCTYLEMFEKELDDLRVN